MIISASRRTDIPAFYSEWFFNRIRAGFVLVRNPMNIHQVSKIRLTPDVVDCFVFWTKNPKSMIENSDLLNIITVPFYFQFTVNPYNKELEPLVPEKKIIFEVFIKLSSLIGKERMIWRYDPIIFTDKIDIAYHIKYFDLIAKTLSPFTNKCVISFLDFYKKTQRNMNAINFIDISSEQKLILAKELFNISNRYGLKLVTCAEDIDTTGIGIRHGKCIDPGLIAYLCGGKVVAKKDKNQRDECGCIESIDIGSYNTCTHGCLYCYANFNKEMVHKQFMQHSPESPLLFGHISSEDTIIDREMYSVIDFQKAFL